MHPLKIWRMSFKKKITQTELARMLGGSKNILSKICYWEKGRIPSAHDMGLIKAATKGRVKIQDFYRFLQVGKQ